ncbi:hypothetical protein [Saccharothrix coeruleofusca]|uniref:Uncharacterized protein n=1 Tax=Saccharothrix coeruleofusca TaxID=33919 RepID=A0A918AJ07_9PSEU|nr:hypothetical protein [Saccharothrix coeruleofusca]GGP38606.1 hypothetical protein GCM10010185_07640 [Saccharothrix coeruleofusca]
MGRRIGGPGGGSDKGGTGGGAVLAGVVVALAAAAGVGGDAVLSRLGESPPRTNSNSKADNRKSARDADSAVGRLGLKVTKRFARQDAECLTSSWGRVREFLARTPCRSLDRLVFAVGDGAGDTAVVSVVWVGFANGSQTRRFRDVMDEYGSGDIKPLGSGLLGLADVRFTAAHYGSRVSGSTTTVAETEALTGHVDADLLDALAEVAAELPRPTR